MTEISMKGGGHDGTPNAGTDGNEDMVSMALGQG